MKIMLLILIAVSFGIKNVEDHRFNIEATIDGSYNGPILFIVGSDSLPGIVRDHKVAVTGQVRYPAFMTIKIPGSSCGSKILVENSHIELFIQTIKSESNLMCAFVKKVSGSKSDSLYKTFKKSVSQIPQSPKQLNQQRLRNAIEEFINANPDFSFNAFFINEYLQTVGTTWAEKMLAKLPASVLESPQGIQLRKDLGRMIALEKDKAFADFNMKTIDEQIFSTSTLRGKYILYDFWASWCLPCRKENPHLVADYNMYKSKGFEIVGISLDHDALKWQEAIKKDQLPWIHLSDLKGWQNEAAVKFQISSLPFNILVGPDGKIISTNVHGEELSKQLKAIFAK